MSLARLDTRVAHLEARRARTTSPSGLVVVWMADGDTRYRAPESRVDAGSGGWPYDALCAV